MFLSVREMEVRELRFEESFRPGEIEFFDRKLWQDAPLQTSGVAELLPNTDGEIRVRGSLSVQMAAECDRCLEKASFPIEASFDLYYEPAVSGLDLEERELAGADGDVDFYEGGGLELEDILREQVLLALPMRRVCREDCKGICPVCGQNRNMSACSCRPRLADDRWAALREL